MKNSPIEEVVARMRALQGYILSNVYPDGLSRSEAVKELMTLKRTITKRKKDAQKS
jgi:ethanolamine ammonia-lyase small subunit